MSDDSAARNALLSLIREAAADKAAPKQAKSNWDKLDVDIVHEGRAITLPADPENMPLGKAIEALVRKQKDEEQPFMVHEIFDAYPHDAAVAFVKAMQNLYGWASPQSTPGFFGPRPPEMLSVKTGFRDEDVIQCPMGAFKLPGVDAPIKTLIGPYGVNDAVVFLVHGEIKKKDRHIILELTTEARRILKTESIYKGRPIRLGVHDNGVLDTNRPPEFLDVSEISEESLVFDAEIQSQIDTNILVPLRETESCRKHKIPLKRGILLEGPYGTGKSLTARMAARVAELNGWTFILLDKVQGLRVALEFANRYAPAIVFAEDIDRVADKRDEATNDLINIIDGVVSKRAEVMTILTTNHVEKLDRVILRPGRLDAIISIRAPGPEAVRRLIKHYAGDLLPDGVNLTNAGEALAGQIPASIRECVERAKLGMIGRKAKKLADSDLVTAALTMKNHLALLAPKAEEQTPAQRLADSLHSVVNNGFGAKIDKLVEVTEEVKRYVS